KEFAMKRIFTLSLVVALIAVFALFSTYSNKQVRASNEGNGQPEIIHHGTNVHEAGALTVGSTGTITPAIVYGGGALIQTPTVYFIWYGNWNQTNGSDTAAGQQILRDFGHAIGGSAYFQINTTYSAGGFNISGNVNFGGEYTDTGSRG